MLSSNFLLWYQQPIITATETMTVAMQTNTVATDTAISASRDDISVGGVDVIIAVVANSVVSGLRVT